MSFFNTPKKFWKQIFLGQEADEGEGRWVTIHGVHVFIREGESLSDAVNYLKIREFNKNYSDKVDKFDKLWDRGASPSTLQKYLDKNINKPLREGYETLPKFFRGSDDEDIFHYLITGKFQAGLERDLPENHYTSLTLSPDVAYYYASVKKGVVVEFESDEVKAKGISEPIRYLQYGYQDNDKLIRDGWWNKDQGSFFIGEAEIKAKNLHPEPHTLTVYADNPKGFYEWMKQKYIMRYEKNPPEEFIKRLNSIKLRSLKEFKKKYSVTE